MGPPWTGPAVHLLARIVAAALPATVLVSGELRDHVPARTARSAGLHVLPGFGEPVELLALLP
jgi:class 3 adenylate cyclase